MKSVIHAFLVGSILAGAVPFTLGEASAVTLLEDSSPTQNLATQIIDSLMQRDAKALESLFDIGGFAERTNLKVPADSRAPADAFSSVINELCSAIMTLTSDGSKATLLRAHQVDGEDRLMIRIAGEGGVAYLDFVVGQDSSKTIDVYTTHAGELLSDRLAHRLLRAALARANNDPKFLEEARTFADMSSALLQNDAKTVLELYEKLDTFKRDRATQVMRLQAACSIADAAMLDQVSGEYLKAYPDDISGSFLMIDGYTVLEQYDKAMASVDVIDKSVGGDPYLEFLRANLYVLMKDDASAKKHLEAGLSVEPQLEELANRMADFAITEANNAEIKRWLLHLEKYCGYEFNDDLNNAEAFGEFKKSAEYQAWLKEKKS